MSAPALQAHLRKATGKTDNQRLRRLQKIPAALNGLSGVLHLEMDEEPTRHALEKLTGTHELMPLSVFGEASGVRKGGGMHLAVRNLEVICLPDQIPMSVDVDVSGLDLDTILRVEELTLPEGVQLVSKENFVVASIVGRMARMLDSEEEEAAEETPEEATAEA